MNYKYALVIHPVVLFSFQRSIAWVAEIEVLETEDRWIGGPLQLVSVIQYMYIILCKYYNALSVCMRVIHVFPALCIFLQLNSNK